MLLEADMAKWMVMVASTDSVSRDDHQKVARQMKDSWNIAGVLGVVGVA